MPKETIRILSDEDPNIFNLKVGWEKDRHMQIGLESFDHRSLAWILWENSVERIGAEVRRIVLDASQEMYGDSCSEDRAIGKQILNLLDVSTHGPISSIWTSPSRHEVNELIRLLRKARDSAFGRDE